MSKKKAATLEMRPYLACMDCGEHRWYVGHLLDEDAFQTRWSCDQCGAEHDLTFGRGQVIAGLTGKRVQATRVLMRANLGNGSLWLIARGRRFHDEPIDGPVFCDRDRYYYEDHTCPTNYFRNACDVLWVADDAQDSDADPHGLFEYMATSPAYDGGSGEMTVSGHLEKFGMGLPSAVALSPKPPQVDFLGSEGEAW